MASRRHFPPIIFFLLMGFTVCSSYISDDFFAREAVAARRLLQTKKSCPINFETMNYTIITSQCKGPRYSSNLCCGALKQFACPYSDELNDLTNDCATTMFSYINLYGKYPPGLFASQCREGKEGLACVAEPPKSGSHTLQAMSPLLTLLILGLLLLCVQIL